MFHSISSPRLRILACNPEILEQALAGDSALATYLKVSVPENWTEFGPEALQYSLDFYG